MTNYLLTIKKTTYTQSQFATRSGHALSASYSRDGLDKPRSMFVKLNVPIFDVVDEALAKLFVIVSESYDTADVTVDVGDYTLTAAQQTTLKEKYELETQINSITFA